MLRAMNVTAKDVYGVNKYSGRNFLVDELHLGSDNDMGGNPVGILQELCMKMKQPPPNYDVSHLSLIAFKLENTTSILICIQITHINCFYSFCIWVFIHYKN